MDSNEDHNSAGDSSFIAGFDIDSLTDYYAILNVQRNDTVEEINKAFRRLSRVFHPDKHTDAAQKLHAESIFQKIKTAHEVLSDTNRRTIYDLYGERGLRTEGWEIVERRKTVQEIKDEYEHLKRNELERLLQQKANPKGSLIASVDCTELFDRLNASEKDEDEEEEVQEESNVARQPVAFTRMQLTQSVDVPFTANDRVTLLGVVRSERGQGSGTATVNWRRTFARYVNTSFETAVICDVGSSPTSKSPLDDKARRRGAPWPAKVRFGFETYRSIAEHFGVALSGSLLVSGSGLRAVRFTPQTNATLAYVFAPNWTARLAWNALAERSMQFGVEWARPDKRASAECVAQAGFNDSFVEMKASRTVQFPAASSSSASVKNRTTFKVRLHMSSSDGLTFYVGVHRFVTEYTQVGATVALGTSSGVSVYLRLARGPFNYLVPIRFSESVQLDSTLASLALPFTIYLLARHLVWRPLERELRRIEVEKAREQYAEVIQEKKREAEAMRRLMSVSVDRIIQREEFRNGLIIVNALYGKFDRRRRAIATACIDVTEPLQALVEDSKLILTDAKTKSSLPGFYDPAIAEEKQLVIRYRFLNKLHEACFTDDERVALPQAKHRLPDSQQTDAE